MAAQRMFIESVVEEATLDWLAERGYAPRHGPHIAFGERGAERVDPYYDDVILEGRPRQALALLNPDLPMDAIEDAYRKIKLISGASLLARNRAFHRMLVAGVAVEYRREDGSIAGRR